MHFFIEIIIFSPCKSFALHPFEVSRRPSNPLLCLGIPHQIYPSYTLAFVNFRSIMYTYIIHQYILCERPRERERERERERKSAQRKVGRAYHMTFKYIQDLLRYFHIITSLSSIIASIFQIRFICNVSYSTCISHQSS